MWNSGARASAAESLTGSIRSFLTVPPSTHHHALSSSTKFIRTTVTATTSSQLPRTSKSRPTPSPNHYISASENLGSYNNNTSPFSSSSSPTSSDPPQSSSPQRQCSFVPSHRSLSGERHHASLSSPFSRSDTTVLFNLLQSSPFLSQSQSRLYSSFPNSKLPSNLRHHEAIPTMKTIASLLGSSPITRSDLLRLLGPSLFAKIPKGFEKFFPEEVREELEKRSASSSEKQRSDDSSNNNESDKRGTNGGNGGKNNNNGGGQGQPPSSQAMLMFLSFLVFCALWSYSSENRALLSSGPNQITVQHFLNTLLAKGYVQRVDIINKEVAKVVLRPDCPADVVPAHGHYSFRIGSVDSFESKLEAFQFAMGLHPTDFVPIQHVQEVDLFAEFMSYLPTFAVVAVSLFLLRRLASVGAANDPNKFLKMGRANPVSGKDVKVKIKFSDVAGMKEAKNEIKEFVDFLKDPRKYQQLGAHIPKGALLVGPPGTGKTLLAKAVAGEANVPFFSMSGSDFIEVFVGVGPSRVRDLFAQARKHSPSIIFIDEIDAVGRKRAKGGFAGGANDERENTLNQMLVEMDGFTTSTGVVVLAGTNRADILDPALTRPGRFDRTVNIEKPDLAERTEIFKIHMKPLKLDPSLDPEETNKRLAALTPGFVGADIQNVCNEGAIYAARRNASGVSIQDFENACERVLGGMKKSNSFINQDLRRVIAFHEAGHAVAGWFLKYGDPVLKVSIVPRTNGALGFAQNLPEEVQLLPREQVLDKIAVLLGGRVSEELNIGRISTGAQDDLDKVTKLAYAFTCVWGFNPKVGLMSFQNRDEAQYYKPYSEQLAQLMDNEVRDLIDREYKRVKTLLSEKKDLLQKLTDRLLLQETITFNDLREVLGERPHPLKAEYAQYVEASPNRPPPTTGEASNEDIPSSPSPSTKEDGHSSSSGNDPTTTILTDESGVVHQKTSTISEQLEDDANKSNDATSRISNDQRFNNVVSNLIMTPILNMNTSIA